MLGIAGPYRSWSRELVFPNDPFATIGLRPDAVLGRTFLFGEQSDDRIEPARRAVLAGVRRKPHTLPRRIFVSRHQCLPENVTPPQMDGITYRPGLLRLKGYG